MFSTRLEKKTESFYLLSWTSAGWGDDEVIFFPPFSTLCYLDCVHLLGLMGPYVRTKNHTLPSYYLQRSTWRTVMWTPGDLTRLCEQRLPVPNFLIPVLILSSPGTWFRFRRDCPLGQAKFILVKCPKLHSDTWAKRWVHCTPIFIEIQQHLTTYRSSEGH